MSQRDNQQDFRWGLKSDVRSNDSDVTFYKSFFYNDVEYFQFDCVYMYREGAKETDIGKILRMWEKKREKRLKILWFFRPVDIFNCLRDYEPSWNELFLASGNGAGLCNIVPPEAIIGKCTVMCSSKDSRNVLPSKSDLGRAEYIFSHVFDVEKLRVSHDFPDKIDNVKVERLFNQGKDRPRVNVNTGAEATGVSSGARARDSGNPVLSVRKVCQPESANLKVHTKTNVVKDEPEDYEQRGSEYRHIKKKIRLAEVADLDREKYPLKKEEDPTSILDPVLSYNCRSPKIKASNSPANQSPELLDKERSYCTKHASVYESDVGTTEVPATASPTGNSYHHPTNIQQSAELDDKDASPPRKSITDNDSAVEISQRLAIVSTKGRFSDLPANIHHNAEFDDKDTSLPTKHVLFNDPTVEISQINPIVRLKRKASESSASTCLNTELDDKDSSLPSKRVFHNDSAVEISQRPAIDKRRWFNRGPWEERIKKACEERALVHLDNLDSSYTSSDVQDMILNAFSVKADAKIRPYGYSSSPSHGKALAIFDSKGDADFVISELRQKCLMVGGRPVVAYRSDLKESDQPSNFHGHLAFERLKKIKREQKVVSTSHCSQSNTLEYDMAVQWRILQKRTENWWKALHKNQADEISKLQNTMKSGQSNQNTP